MNNIEIRTRFNKYNDGLLSRMKDKIYNCVYDQLEAKIIIINVLLYMERSSL